MEKIISLPLSSKSEITFPSCFLDSLQQCKVQSVPLYPVSVVSLYSKVQVWYDLFFLTIFNTQALLFLLYLSPLFFLPQKVASLVHGYNLFFPSLEIQWKFFRMWDVEISFAGISLTAFNLPFRTLNHCSPYPNNASNISL